MTKREVTERDIQSAESELERKGTPVNLMTIMKELGSTNPEDAGAVVAHERLKRGKEHD